MERAIRVRVSKLLSLVLRHRPEKAGIVFDGGGWASIQEIVDAAERHRPRLTREMILEIVAADEKGRFALSPDGKRIRATQGHSIPVDLGLFPLEPPQHLYHGTSRDAVESILSKGIDSRGRQYVHLSLDPETAVRVGQRHGPPVVLEVDAGGMHRDGLEFFRAQNGVWLTTGVPSRYVRVL